MSTDARGAILSRIRTALGERAPKDPGAIADEWQALPRSYEQARPLSIEAALDLLEERLRDYGAEVSRAADGEVAATVAGVLAARGNRPTLLPEGFPPRWMPAQAPFERDENFSPRQLDRFDGVLTGAALAIAETGTLVLRSAPGEGRRAATLVPDFHLCVVRDLDVVATVPEAFARLAGDPASPITFVSGPSATADIEMTRIQGVHGPRFLHVVLASGSFPG